MSYNVYHTNGNLLTTVPDGTVNNVTSLNLVGIGYLSYSEAIAEDLVHLMENFANPVAPIAPIVGQLWWNTLTNKLNIFDGNSFKSINNVAVSTVAPAVPSIGDFWYDSNNQQLNYFATSGWQLVAPAYSQSQGLSGQLVQTINDISGVSHTITSEYDGGSLIAVLSKDTFVPQNFAGFTNLYQGINMGLGYELIGTASNSRISQGLTRYAAKTFMSANSDAYTTGNLAVFNNNFVMANTVTFNVNTSSQVFHIDPYTINYFKIAYNTFSIDLGNTFVGIGLENPQYTLDVNGDANVRGDLYMLANVDRGIYWDTNVGTRLIHTTQNDLYLQHGSASINLASDDGVTISALSVSGQTSTNGITNTGDIINAQLPTQNPHLANKQYVDQKFQQAYLPIGSVIMWYGLNSAVPNGWQICDGTNGTPDLRDRFVMGAGGSANYGDTGGVNTVAAQTGTAGGHQHTGNTTSAGIHQHNVTITSVPAHTHDFYDVYGYMDDVDNVTIGNFNFVNGVPTYYPYNPASNIGITTNALTNRPNGYPTTYFVDADNKPVQPVLYYNQGRPLNGYQFFFQNTEGGVGPQLSTSGIDHVQFAFKNRTLSTGAGPVTTNTDISGSHIHTLSTDPVGDHFHTINTENRPAFVALYYIMRVS